jgi:hypothetical protein
VVCSAITKAGTRCRLDATHGSYCYQHSPETVEERRRNARRGGKAGGNGRPSAIADVLEARSYTKGMISRLLKGDLSRDVAAVAFQGINTLMRVVEQERRIRESDELEARIEALEQRELMQQSAWRN